MITLLKSENANARLKINYNCNLTFIYERSGYSGFKILTRPIFIWSVALRRHDQDSLV